jgi:hypothetical protein
VNRNPRSSGRGVHQSIEQRPIGNCVRAVAHAFGLAVGRGDGAGVQVIAPDDDGRFDFTGADERVYGEAESCTLAVP